MYALYDSFNKVTISRHRTIKAAVKADIKLQRSLRHGSYIPTVTKRIVKGQLVALTEDESELMLAVYDHYHR